MASGGGGGGSRNNTATGFSDIHSDIIETHILPRLDGRSLASLTSTSTHFHNLTSIPSLWSHICHSTWPSTSTPQINKLISDFPNGPLTFYSLITSSTTIHTPHHTTATHNHLNHLISAVDIFYKSKPILSKTNETETFTNWFKSSPFRIDILDTKETIPTPIPNPTRDEMCTHLYSDLNLTWNLIDPIHHRAMNVSSLTPVSIHRHWLTGEVQAKFATVVSSSGRDGCEVAVTVEVTCGVREGEDEVMVVREVGMEIEGVDGVRLSGGESIQVLMRGLDGDWKKDEDVRRRYGEFMEMRRVRKEMKVREHGSWDLVCAGAGVVATAVTVTIGYFGSFF